MYIRLYRTLSRTLKCNVGRNVGRNVGCNVGRNAGGDQKCPSIFLTVSYVKDHIYNVLKSCHQDSYVFQNLMSSLRVGS